jgi:hypothetical protein
MFLSVIFFLFANALKKLYSPFVTAWPYSLAELR